MHKHEAKASFLSAFSAASVLGDFCAVPSGHRSCSHEKTGCLRFCKIEELYAAF